MGRGRRSLVAAGALAIAVAILGLGFTPDVFAAGPSTVHIVHGRLGTPRIVVAAHLAKSAHPRLNRRFLTDDPVSFARGKADAASGHGGRRTGVVNLETSEERCCYQCGSGAACSHRVCGDERQSADRGLWGRSASRASGHPDRHWPDEHPGDGQRLGFGVEQIGRRAGRAV